ADPAPALAGRQADAGHARPAQLLGTHLPGGAQGAQGPLSEASMAGRSMGCDTDAPRQAARNLTHSWPDSPRIGTMRAPYRMTAPVSETRLFQTLVDALDVPRHAQRRVAAALRRELKAMSAVEIEAFQRGFDVALAELRTPELW